MAPPIMVQASKRRKSTPTRERVNEMGKEVEVSGIRICPAYFAASVRSETALLLIIILPPAHTGSRLSASYLGNKVQPVKILQRIHVNQLASKILCQLSNSEKTRSVSFCGCSCVK